MSARTTLAPQRRARWAAGAMVAASAVLLAAGIGGALAADQPAGSDVWSLVGFVVTVAVFSVVGGLVAARCPDNPVGWMLAAVGLLFGVVVAASGGSKWALETRSLPQDVGEWLSVAANIWVIALGIIGTQLPLRLPDGHLPSPRWRWFSRLTIVLIAVSTLGMAAQPGRVEGVAGTANPVDLPWARPLAGVFLLVIACFVGGVVGLVRRYRRADAHDQAQLRWIAFGGAVFLVVYVVTLPLAGLLGLPGDSPGANAITGVSQMAFAALPISIGYAILRRRLYDIDLVVSRTLVYAALTATLAAAYLGSVLLLQLALGGLTQDSGPAVAGSTLAVAALFRPARARIQDWVDRRFYRRRYDAQRTLEAFAARLRAEVELGTVDADLTAVVGETLAPAHVSLWLREAPGR